MAIFKEHGRQYPLWAYQEVALADLTTAVEVEAIDLPRNAVVIDGFVEVTVAFDDTTTATVIVGDVVDPNRYTATPVNLKALGITKLDAVASAYVNGGAISITPAFGTNDNTVGTVRIGVAYVTYGKANENQPI